MSALVRRWAAPAAGWTTTLHLAADPAYYHRLPAPGCVAAAFGTPLANAPTGRHGAPAGVLVAASHQPSSGRFTDESHPPYIPPFTCRSTKGESGPLLARRTRSTILLRSSVRDLHGMPRMARPGRTLGSAAALLSPVKSLRSDGREG